jgi:hypothetical protein
MPDDRQDLIVDYLRELGARLRTRDADLVLAETEDHLRESVAAGLAIGMTEREAQEGPGSRPPSPCEPAATCVSPLAESWLLAESQPLAG